jgi:hypothetical protein
MKHQRGNLRRDSQKLYFKKDKLVIARRDDSIDGAFKPDRCPMNEQSIRRANLPIDAAEPIPRFGGKLPANLTVGLSQNTHTHSLGRFQDSPGAGAALDTNRDQRRFKGNRRKGACRHADRLPIDDSTNGSHPAWEAPVGVAEFSTVRGRHHRNHGIASRQNGGLSPAVMSQKSCQAHGICCRHGITRHRSAMRLPCRTPRRELV